MFCKGDSDDLSHRFRGKETDGNVAGQEKGSPEADLQAQRALRFEAGVGRRKRRILDGFPRQGERVQSLVRELRSHTLHTSAGQPKDKKLKLKKMKERQHNCQGGLFSRNVKQRGGCRCKGDNQYSNMDCTVP